MFSPARENMAWSHGPHHETISILLEVRFRNNDWQAYQELYIDVAQTCWVVWTRMKQRLCSAVRNAWPPGSGGGTGAGGVDADLGSYATNKVWDPCYRHRLSDVPRLRIYVVC